MSFGVLIDIGGTFLKGSTIVDGEGPIGPVVRRLGPALKINEESGVSLEPASLVRALIDLCAELVGFSSGKCSGIFLTGQMHGVILTDHAGNAVTDVITWRDSLKAIVANRLVSPSKAISREYENDRFVALGNELRDGIPLATLYARKSRGQQIDGLVPHSLLSYCGMALSDSLSPPVMHVTDAAAHGFYNLEASEWDIALLGDLGLGGMELPSVVNEIEISGFSKSFGCPIYTPVGDHQAALLGVGLDVGELSLNIATGSQVSVVGGEDCPEAQRRPYFANEVLSTFTHIPAGRALNQLIELVGELSELATDEIWQRVALLTSAVPHSTLELDLSFFPSATGETGRISNISESNLTVGSLFRAAINEMVSNYRYFANKLIPNREPESIVLSGGLASRFPSLSDAVFSEFSESAVRVADLEDASLVGLSKLSQVGG